ncbi:carbonic anhydrase 2-like [Pectinophora gossypiella]|uniref:carbonic anhydrase 2-like n=1 Tax=Pectinophora gossypiella TaxID=13191 RepID=UPI00214E346E|nr:carbonic anhydrase 2-like [Pectinophora gossypiella]
MASKSTDAFDEEERVQEEEEPKREPTYGTVEWIYYWSDTEGLLPTPLNVSITGAIKYSCPSLRWYNFDVYPHKIKMTNTGYTVLIGAKWKTERPYLEGGVLLERHVLSQIHFHWGPNLMDGSEHSVDNRKHPAEMHVSFFKSEYLTQEEALKHDDGVVMFCYIIKMAVDPDPRLTWVIDAFPKIREPQSRTRIGPLPMSKLMPMFAEDYFLYWGNLPSAKGDNFIIRWLVPRVTLFATSEQIKEFRKLWDPWDEPNPGNCRPLQEQKDRKIFLINPHFNLYNSLLPLPTKPEPSISVLSDEYTSKPWMLPSIEASLQAVLEKALRGDEPEEEQNKLFVIN